MVSLYLLRHGDALPKKKGHLDLDRPLSPKGIKEVENLLKAPDVFSSPIQIALCSSAQRTHQTLQILQKGIPALESVDFLPNLYGGSWEDILREINIAFSTWGPKNLLLITHNPGLSDFYGQVTGDFSKVLTTGALTTYRLKTEVSSALSINHVTFHALHESKEG